MERACARRKNKSTILEYIPGRDDHLGRDYVIERKIHQKIRIEIGKNWTRSEIKNITEFDIGKNIRYYYDDQAGQ